LRNGLSFVAGHRIAFVVVLTSALFGLASGMFGALIVPFLRQSLHTSTRVTGIVFALAGAGGLLGGVLAAPLLARIGARRLTILSDVAAVGTFAVLVSAGGITEALPAMAGVGVTNSLYSTGMNTLLQTAVPADYLGRTFGVYSAAASAASLLSAAVPLLLLPAIGIRPTLLAALGVATVAGTVSLVGLSSSQSRRLAGESAA
jgi:MFS family permease